MRRIRAAELTSGFMAYALETLGAERIFAETAPENQAALRVLARLGFASQGEKNRQYDFLPGMTKQELWDYRKETWQSGGRDASLSGLKLYTA